MNKNYYFLIIFLGLIGCTVRKAPAPIVNATQIPPYFVNDKLVAPKDAELIDKSEEDDSVQLSSLKNDDNSNVKKQDTISKEDTVSKEPKIKETPVTKQAKADWQLPIKDGVIINNFSEANKGIDITGKLGQSVFASKEGKVVYSGGGLKNYGNLIIIRHNNGYLTAYGYNKINLVQNGDEVYQGQEIARMGNNSKSIPILHFEIRQNGKPVNPLKLINTDDI